MLLIIVCSADLRTGREDPSHLAWQMGDRRDCRPGAMDQVAELLPGARSLQLSCLTCGCRYCPCCVDGPGRSLPQRIDRVVPGGHVPGCGASLGLGSCLCRQFVSRLVDHGCAQQSAWLADLEVVEYSSERAGLWQGVGLLDFPRLVRQVI